MLKHLLDFMLNAKIKAKNVMSFLQPLSQEERRDFFIKKTLPQSDNDFVTDCFKDNFTYRSPEQKRVALIIRNSIAEISDVSSCYIRSDSPFSGLHLLPVWSGDSFETAHLIQLIEVGLAIQYTEKQLELSNIRDPSLSPDMRISDFVNGFYYWHMKITS
jgi:hypothetical protein